VRSGDVALVSVIGGFFLLLANFSLGEIVGYIYHPVAGLIALLLIIQYLWLKSADRTRIYRMEIDRLRGQRRRDEELLRQCRDLIEASASGDPESVAPLVERLKERL
jgi:hypothetical protein